MWLFSFRKEKEAGKREKKKRKEKRERRRTASFREGASTPRGCLKKEGKKKKEGAGCLTSVRPMHGRPSVRPKRPITREKEKKKRRGKKTRVPRTAHRNGQIKQRICYFLLLLVFSPTAISPLLFFSLARGKGGSG